MTIEFNCPNCQKLLRTKDEKAGVKAKCPDCGTSITVPFPDDDSAAAEDEFGIEDDYGEEEYEDDYAAAPPRSVGTKSCPMCGEKIKANFVRNRATDGTHWIWSWKYDGQGSFGSPSKMGTLSLD